MHTRCAAIARLAAPLAAIILLGCGDPLAPGSEPGSLTLDDRDAPQSKPIPTVESRLEEVVDTLIDLGHDAALARARDLAVPVNDGLVQVVFLSRPGLTADVGERLTRAGAVIEHRHGRLIQALVRPAQIEPLSLTPGVDWVRPPLLATEMITSEGVRASAADAWQATTPFAGSGEREVRIGVVDLGFVGHGALIGSELPPAVTARSFRRDRDLGAGSRHGTAVAEIIHDMVPSAALWLVNFQTEVEFAQAVDYLIGQDVTVISCSLGWFNAGPGDGRGVINDIVRRATARGIVWVNSAGNEAETHWDGTFQSPDGDGFHDFVAGRDETNGFFADAGEELCVYLSWDDWFDSANDYDLLLFGPDLERIAASVSVQNGSQEPSEVVCGRIPRSGTYHIAIYRAPGARVLPLRLFLHGRGTLQYPVSARSLIAPADSADVLTVGAAHWNSRQIERFSSRGPTSDGRTKPDLAAWDGVSTNSFPTFFGTSAAAPHVAGALGLMQSRIGSAFAMAELRTILEARAVDAGPAGADDAYGKGLLRMTP